MSRATIVLLAILSTTLASAQTAAPRSAGHATEQAMAPTIEQKIAQLEKRLAVLEGRFNTHTHEYTLASAGFLSEPINGRRINLAIDPRAAKSQTGPASPTVSGGTPPVPAPAPAPAPAPVSKPASQAAARMPAPVTPEQRIAQLEKQMAALEAAYAAHTHEYTLWSAGFLSEPINGRRINLAIDPRAATTRTGPPQP